MHKSARKCNETLGKWCKNKHGASKIIDTLEMYQASTFGSLVLYPTGSINLGFILRETCCCAHHTFLLGFTNMFSGVNYTPAKQQSSFSGAVAREKEDFCKGSLSLPTFYIVIVLLYFIFACII
jgi:hypothetical protein